MLNLPSRCTKEKKRKSSFGLLNVRTAGVGGHEIFVGS